MSVTVRKYENADVPAMTEIWNDVVRDAAAFPQDTELDEASAAEFFAAQTFTAAAVDDSGEVVGMYILHPNNVGRCGHICNASYAVRRDRRGEHIGELLVRDSLEAGKRSGFRVLQFNAVTAANKGAQALYERIGFTRVGMIPGGFRKNDGSYDGIFIYYKEL